MKACFLLLLPVPIILALLGFLAFFGISANTVALPTFEPPDFSSSSFSSAADNPQLLATGDLEIYLDEVPGGITTSVPYDEANVYDILAVDATQTYYQIDFNGVPAWVRFDDDIIVPANLSNVPVIELAQ